MSARPFDTDAPYIVHPRAAALHYEPLPIATLRQLTTLGRLMRGALDEAELDWLVEQAALVTAETASTQPVRHVNAERRDRRPRHEVRYGRRGFGPRNNASGRSKS